MFVGFNLRLSWESSKYLEIGRSIFADTSKRVRKQLDSFLHPDGVINGTQLADDWFPLEESDVFLSHAHIDEPLAITLAGLLSHEFDLKVFIDSAIWGHADDLLKAIDKKYCRHFDGASYSYEKRNGSTSHVHIMLATALGKMMEKSECLLFLNTPNSLDAASTVARTFSPWIYHELATSKIIRRQSQEEILRRREKTFSKSLDGINESLQVLYDVPTEHLIPLSKGDLANWIEQRDLNEFSLDTLYRLKLSGRL
jgi:hypothetical protein